jgi:PIN domain nuclease of toxin-antitoxin system
LVDTHILLWARLTPEKLTQDEKRVLSAASVRFVSVVTLWEIATLIRLSRIADDDRLLGLPEGFDLRKPPPRAALMVEGS